MTQDNSKFGTVEFNGQTLILTQQPYIDYNGEVVSYRADAVDSDDNHYKVLWSPVDGYETMEDESDVCDWTTYTVKRA